MPSLKYPIILVHGLGWRDETRLFRYWGKIPAFLEKLGARVFLSHQDAMSSVIVCGEQVRERIAQVLAKTGAEKVNLIAHSKGGLDSREALRDERCASSVASLVTVSTPHHGSYIAERLCSRPRWFLRPIMGVMTWFYKMRGDKAADAFGAWEGLLPKVCEANNRTDAVKYAESEIFFRSFSAVYNPKNYLDFFYLSSRWLSRFEGANHGVVSVDSAKWLGFSGVIEGRQGKGAAHDAIVGRRGLDYPLKLEDTEVYSVGDFYRLLVDLLLEAGL